MTDPDLASTSLDLADDLLSAAAYLRARHGCTYGLSADDVWGRRIGRLTLAVPADDAACGVGCWSQVEALELAVHVLRAMRWAIEDRRMETVAPTTHDPRDPDHLARVAAVEERLNRAPHVPQPRELQAYLDDLVRIGLRHGLCIRATRDGEVGVVRTGDCWVGYAACIGGGEVVLRPESIGDVVSLDPRQITGHERLRILDGRFGPLKGSAAGDPSS